MAKNKKVLFTNGMDSYCLLMVTDAPKEAIEQWCRHFSEALDNREKISLKLLSKSHYVHILVDSEIEGISEEDVRAMGYDEEYDLCQY